MTILDYFEYIWSVIYNPLSSRMRQICKIMDQRYRPNEQYYNTLSQLEMTKIHLLAQDC